MRKLVNISTYLMLFIVLSVFLNAKILMKPYLQALGKNSVYILVETDSKNAPQASWFSVGKEKAIVKASFYIKTDHRVKTYVHRIKLEGLTPATRYHYQVWDGNDSSETKAFNTLTEGSGEFTFAIMGDCRSGTVPHGKIAKLIEEYNPVFSVYNGDLCYNSSYDAFKKEFFIEEELNLSSQVPFFNTPGNHEKWSKNTRAFTQAPESKSARQEYYSFDAGDLHFLVLSTEHSCRPGSEQYNFAKKDLSGTDKKFKIVVFHESAYCGGGHGDNKEMKKVSEQLFEKSGVDIVITGHSHFYQHNLVNGIHHMTIAGAGAPLYTPKDTEYTLKSVKDYHFGIAEYKENVLKITVYNILNQKIDELVLDKNK